MMTTEERVLAYGCDYCVYCGEDFSIENLCYNDCGYSEKYHTLHIDGECENCAAKYDAQLDNYPEE